MVVRFVFSTNYWLPVQCRRDTLDLINVVTLRYSRLVPGWVTVFGRLNHLATEPGSQAYSA